MASLRPGDPQMTDPSSWPTVVVAIVAALPATIIAFATLLKTIRIHEDTNSNLTKVTQKLADSDAKIQILQSRIEKLLSESPPPTTKP